MDLTFYIEKYGSDKRASRYTLIDHPLLNHLRDTTNAVLEIGVGTYQPEIPSTFVGNAHLYPHYTPGGSLRAWRDYFPNANVYGVDIAEDCRLEEDRIKTFIFSSLDNEKCDSLLPNFQFDLIVDDGLHTALAQITTLKNLFKRVKANGYYIIEDVGGGGDGVDIIEVYNNDLKQIIEGHEYHHAGNAIFIRKNYSGAGEISSYAEFLERNSPMPYEEALIPMETPAPAPVVLPNTNLKEIFQDVYTNWRFGGWPESKSGGGSTMEETEIIRQQIKQLVKDKEIKSVVDVPCGDFNWMKDIVYSFESYTGCDIVPGLIADNQKYANQIIKFQELDLTQGNIPEADLLIVRDVIGHLTLNDGKKIVENILKSKCKYLLTTTWYSLEDEKYYEKHTNFDREVTLDRQWEAGAAQFYPVCLHSTPFNFPKPEFYIEEKPKVDGYENGVRKGLAFYEISKLREQTKLSASIPEIEATEDLTLVTGLWNINRPGRDFNHYIENFKKFLDIPVKMFIYIPAEYEYLVWEKRSRKNTYVKIFELDDIKNNYYSPFWDATQKIRTNPEWYNQAGWLPGSPQASNEWYNPIVQSKMFMLHDAKIMNVFDTDYFLWLDAGITNTVYEKYFTEHKCLDKIIPYLKTFLFVSYPYQANNEIHGFDFKTINRYAREEVKNICRGGLFGGHKDYISEASSTYYALLQDTLNTGYMGTEESLFSIMAYLEPHIYRRYALEDNGLIVKFTQALLDDQVQLENNGNRAHVLPKGTYNESTDKTSLYMLTFNFPEQIEHTLATWQANSPDWLNKPSQKILIDNSTDPQARIGNKAIADKYGFEHIIMHENKGINGGRLFAAEHFDKSDSDYYFFFEDDMGFYPSTETELCRNGFRKYVPNLYKAVHEIMAREDLDFLKLSYTEVYMDNNIQVSWYNVPQSVRSYTWPDYDQLPINGLDPYAPRTKFDKIEVHNGLSYITGEIYYANWPMIVNKKGNYKMFLETKWDNPFEQTWMSYMFQESMKNNIKPAVLLAAPVWHNRIAYYKPEERREN